MLGTGLGSETQPAKVSFGWGGQDRLPRGGTGEKVGHRAGRVLGETGQGERATQTGTQQPIPSCDPPLRALTLVLWRMDTTQTRRLLSKLLAARWVLEFRIFQVLERKFSAWIADLLRRPAATSCSERSISAAKSVRIHAPRDLVPCHPSSLRPVGPPTPTPLGSAEKRLSPGFPCPPSQPPTGDQGGDRLVGAEAAKEVSK